MSVSGGCKFFERMKNLDTAGGDASDTEGQPSAPFVCGRNPFVHWRTQSSDDTTTEDLEITFNSASINRIILLDHNFKEFNIKYDVASVWTNFTSVVGINGATYGSGISETVFAYSSSYYEFAAVTTTKIRVQITKTQTVDDQKRLRQAIVTKEIGTFSGYPTIEANSDRRKFTKEMLSGRTFVDYSTDNFDGKIKFQNYPTSYAADVNLLRQLNVLNLPFHIFPCGGRTGSTYFKHSIPGFTIDYCPLVLIKNELSLLYDKNVYINPINLNVDLVDAP